MGSLHFLRVKAPRDLSVRSRNEKWGSVVAVNLKLGTRRSSVVRISCEALTPAKTLGLESWLAPWPRACAGRLQMEQCIPPAPVIVW